MSVSVTVSRSVSMPKRPAKGLVLCGLLVLCSPWAGSAPARADEPAALVEPRLGHFESDVRRQLDKLARAAEASGKAEDYGALGEAYFAYELTDEASTALAEAARRDRLDGDPDARWPYLGALAALGLSERELADRRFDEALAIRPSHLPTLLHSAANLLDLGRLDDAASRYQTAQAVAESSQAGPGVQAALYFGLGRLAAEEGRFGDAIQLFRSALAAQPEADAIYYHLALALRRAGDVDAARDAMSRRGERAPTFRDPWRQRMQARAAGSRVAIRRGLQALRAGRLEAAEPLLRGAVAEHPDDVDALAGLGRVEQLRGRVAEAESLYRRALALDPDSLPVLLNLGVLLARTGHPDAVDLLSRVVAIDPSSAEGHFNLGLQLLRRGDAAGGEAALRRSLELGPDDAAALEALARSLAARGEFGDAAEPYRRLLALKPEHPEVHFGLSLALVLGGRCAAARPVLEDAVERFADAALVGLLARVLAACPDDDIRDGARAVELASGLFAGTPNVDTARTLGMALAEAGRTAEAAEHLRRTLEVATRAGADKVLPVLRRELAAYEAGRPVRSPWTR